MPGELHCYCKKIESPKSREKKFEIEIRLEYTSTSDNLLLRNLNLSQMCIFYINYINGNIFYLGFGIFEVGIDLLANQVAERQDRYTNLP